MARRPLAPRIRPSVRAEAAAWLARLHADDRGPADERGFRAWLACSADHRVAFDRVTQAWEVAGGAPPAQAARGRAGATSRRAALASLAVIVVAGGVVAARAVRAETVYETAPGEQKRVGLEDGSLLLLDTDTRVSVRYDDRIRRVRLDCGRVGCRVSADPARPFELRAADARIVAERSDFNVRRDGDAVAVVALEGRLQVTRGGGAASRLDAGERLTTGLDGRAQLDRPPLAPLTAWRSGRAVFDDDTLAEAVDEMNRYSQIKLAIADPSVGEMRLSGVYRLGASSDFANSVANLLPVRLEGDGDHIRMMRDEAR